MFRRLGRAGFRAWLALAAWASRLRGARPQRLLRLHLTGDLGEDPTSSRVRTLLGRKGDDYLSLISLLRWAREDPELQAVLLSIESLGAGWARLQGLRRGLLGLRQAGKKVWVHLTHAGLREYYLASAADRIILTPTGVLDVAGLSAEATFFVGALEKLGIQAEVIQVGRYKSAGEPFTRRDMSPEHREMIGALVDDLYGQIGEAVGESRGLTPAAVLDLLGRGPFVAREACESGLVDDAAYLDEIEKELTAAYEDAPLVERPAYESRRSREMRRRVLRENRGAIALVQIEGAIKTGESSPPTSPATACGSETIARQLAAIEKQTDVAAVVLRINSPGGSGLASDLIWHAVTRLRTQKPVVVSFGDVAASGGYYVAAAGSPVLSEAGTITGSIGVLAGKATLHGLYDRLGITKEAVSRGAHASLHSDYLPLGASERARLETQARWFYDDFVDKVAAGRGLETAAVAAVAEGRVWTGRQALERGLVDRLGGVDDAIAEAKALVGIPLDAPVAVLRLPRARRHWGLSLLRWLPAGERAAAFSPWWLLVLRERVWAVAPFTLRFY